MHARLMHCELPNHQQDRTHAAYLPHGAVGMTSEALSISRAPCYQPALCREGM